jgi:hypothetical protein
MMHQLVVLKKLTSEIKSFVALFIYDKIIFIVMLFFHLIPSHSSAIVPIRDLAEPSIPFYRSPESPFPSGTEDLTILQQSKIQSKSEIWYLIEEQSKAQWVPAAELIFFPNEKSDSINHQRGFIKETTPTLRLNHGWRTNGEIKEGSRVIITSIRSDWSCGIDQENKPLCVASDKVILPIDTTIRVKTNSGQWHNIKARKKHFYLTVQNTYIPISKISEWIPDLNIGFLQTNSGPTELNLKFNKAKISQYKRVLVKTKELKTWNQSHLENHGNVWWQELNLKRNNEIHTFITSDELQSRTIFAKVSSKKSSQMITLASANGIFVSKDGETWNYIEKFGENNFPVAIGPRNTLIVGDQISFDEGKTFQNYLRWDQIAQQTQNFLHHPPKHLKLISINLKSSNRLDVQIDTGYKVLFFDFNTINNSISLRDSRLVNKE